MRCPYCASDVPPAAIVCPHCTRDFYLFKPLLARIEQLETRLEHKPPLPSAAYEERLAALERQVAALSGGRAAGGAAVASKRYWVSSLLSLTPALALLVCSHLVLLFIYDARPIYLRIASMLIPVPFGFALFVWHPQRFRLSAAAGFAMAFVAIWLMLFTTSLIDHVPVVPQNMRDLREVLEYMASIGLAFLTGLLLGKLRYRRLQVSPEPNRFALFLAELFTADKDGELGVLRLAGRIQKMAATLTPIGTGIASIYAGIKALIGDIG